MRGNPFLRAHGYDPGPTQRPVRAGLAAGLVATIVGAIPLLGFGSVAAAARILGLSSGATLAAGAAAMAIAGALYGAVFQRAANDARGGWLFGMAYGFLLWVGGVQWVLPAIGGGHAPAGEAAIGNFIALLLWGAAMGALFPRVHRAIRRRDPWQAMEGCGPSAAAAPHSPRPVASR